MTLPMLSKKSPASGARTSFPSAALSALSSALYAMVVLTVGASSLAAQASGGTAKTAPAKTGTAATQPRTGAAKAGAKPAAAAQPVLVGAWVGKATVPLPDSTIIVPVFYTFTQGPDGTIGGTAMVPGQGSGPISRVVRTGAKLQFRVEVKEGALDHDATFGADGSIEGMVNLNNQPVAKFKIAPKK